MEQNKSPNPMQISPFGLDTVVSYSNDPTHPVQQFLGHRYDLVYIYRIVEPEA